LNRYPPKAKLLRFDALPASEQNSSAAGEVELVVAPASLSLPLAATVATLGWQAYERGLAVDAERLLPSYLRASAAEEKLHSNA
jgi:hypothetical protein